MATNDNKKNVINFINDPFNRQFFALVGITENDISDTQIRVAFPLSKLSGYLTINYRFWGADKKATPYSMANIYKVPAINKEGVCRYITLNKSDIDTSSATLARNLKISLSELQNKRTPIFVTYGIFAIICYSASTANKEQIDNWKGLQIELEKCLSDNVIATMLSDLNEKPNWRDNFLIPFINDVESKLLVKGWKI
jgi:hypothetical protein